MRSQRQYCRRWPYLFCAHAQPSSEFRHEPECRHYEQDHTCIGSYIGDVENDPLPSNLHSDEVRNAGRCNREAEDVAQRGTCNQTEGQRGVSHSTHQVASHR